MSSGSWIAFGWGFLLGCFVFDAAWRILYRKTGKLLQVQREYIVELEALDRLRGSEDEALRTKVGDERD